MKYDTSFMFIFMLESSKNCFDSSGGEIQMNSHQTNIHSYVNIAVPERGMSDELYGETLTVYDSSNVSF